eukprot:2833665-Amphidinium_carterae.2
MKPSCVLQAANLAQSLQCVSIVIVSLEYPSAQYLSACPSCKSCQSLLAPQQTRVGCVEIRSAQSVINRISAELASVFENDAVANVRYFVCACHCSGKTWDSIDCAQSRTD